MKNVVLVLTLLSASVWAQPSPQNSAVPTSDQPDNAALMQKIRDLEDRVIALEGQLRTMKSQSAPPPTAAPAPEAPVAGQPGQQPPAASQTQQQVAEMPPAPAYTSSQPVSLGGAGGSAAKALNPDISAIGDFIGVAGHNPVQPSRSLEMHESEIGMQAIIDPYARGDFFFSFGEEGVEVEEGYITLTALPAGFVMKVGKMRSAFGKVNGMHNHVLPWVDRPLVMNNLVGGEDGIDDAGVSVQRILPAPKGIFLEATGQLFRGDSGTTQSPLFVSSNKSDVAAVAHLRSYKDLSESTNLDLGLSYARGHNDQGSDFLTQLYGIDATLRWKPLRRSIYHSFVGRGEFVWSQRQQFPMEQKAFGFYTSGDYQMGRRWFLGGRFDRSSRSEFANLNDQGVSALLTYWPSEFSQVRGQYRFMHYAGNIDTHEFLMQFIFSLGAHGAHPF
ncbi:MAG TPA: hypothetical protein VMH04_05460 [Candidatus Solibacter sp.]|nr:hypothetical protein [Candidatus Solibacter sp.]